MHIERSTKWGTTEQTTINLFRHMIRSVYYYLVTLPKINNTSHTRLLIVLMNSESGGGGGGCIMQGHGCV